MRPSKSKIGVVLSLSLLLLLLAAGAVEGAHSSYAGNYTDAQWARCLVRHDGELRLGAQVHYVSKVVGPPPRIIGRGRRCEAVIRLTMPPNILVPQEAANLTLMYWTNCTTHGPCPRSVTLNGKLTGRRRLEEDARPKAFGIGQRPNPVNSYQLVVRRIDAINLIQRPSGAPEPVNVCDYVREGVNCPDQTGLQPLVGPSSLPP